MMERALPSPRLLNCNGCFCFFPSSGSLKYYVNFLVKLFQSLFILSQACGQSPLPLPPEVPVQCFHASFCSEESRAFPEETISWHSTWKTKCSVVHKSAWSKVYVFRDTYSHLRSFSTHFQRIAEFVVLGWGLTRFISYQTLTCARLKPLRT